MYLWYLGEAEICGLCIHVNFLMRCENAIKFIVNLDEEIYLVVMIIHSTFKIFEGLRSCIFVDLCFTGMCYEISRISYKLPPKQQNLHLSKIFDN